VAVVRMDIDLFEMSDQRLEYPYVRKSKRHIVD
jgi:hypothetical protein